MKKSVINLSFLFLVFFYQSINASVMQIGGNGYTKSGNSKLKKKNFKRIYTHSEVKRNPISAKKADDISITYEDFLNHFEVGKTKTLSGVFSPINMDIGAINSGTKETWVLPDFSNSSEYLSYTIQQLDAEETYLFDDYGYGSHVLYSEDLGIYELYDLTDFDLYFVGYDQFDGTTWDSYQYDQAKSPIPIELGLQYTSTVDFQTDIDGTYTQYTDIYDVIGQGTLKTFDDGDADAMKMIYKEETREFENNVEISYSERYEIIFYSKRGHYIKADITDPWNSEGVVALSNINYFKLESKTASVNDEVTSDLKVFPNPINAGEILTIESQNSLENNVVEVFTINGQKVSTLQFTKTNNNQYQTSVPQKLASGIYFYKVHDQKGGFLKNGKIQVK